MPLNEANKLDLQKQLDTLNEVNKSLIGCETIEQVITKALQQVRDNLNVQVASIFLFNKDGYIQRMGINGIDKDGQEIDGNKWFPDEKYLPGESFSGKPIPPSGSVLNYGNPHYSNSLVEEYETMINGTKYKEKLGELQAGISVPLNGLNRTFGTLEVLNKTDKKNHQIINFETDDIYMLMLIGTTVANLVADIKKKNKLRIYNEMTNKLIQLESGQEKIKIKEMYDFVTQELVQDLICYKVCIIRIANEKDEFEITSQHKTQDISWDDSKEDSITKKNINSIVQQVYTTEKKCIIINDLDSALGSFINKTWIEKNNLKSIVCFPLSLSGEKAIGTLSVYTGYNHEFYGSGIDFLKNVASLLAAIVAIDRYKTELHNSQLELEHEKRKFMNASRALGFDSAMKNFLHKYKNELIEFSEDLLKLSEESTKNISQKEEIIQQRVEWIKDRVEEIRKVFQADNNGLNVVNINDLVKDIVRLFPSIRRKINITQEYDSKIPLIEINAEKIKDVIYNLIDNAVEAIKRSSKNNKQIKIKTHITILDSINYIQVIIEDNGIGIDNNLKEKIFERGFTTNADSGGTGMGLFVAREIISNYGGRLEFTSKVGKGTTFYLSLPLKRYQK